MAYDRHEHAVALFDSDWASSYFEETNAGIKLSTLPPESMEILTRHIEA